MLDDPDANRRNIEYLPSGRAYHGRSCESPTTPAAPLRLMPHHVVRVGDLAQHPAGMAVLPTGLTP
jgi:hypothetical protein